MIDATSSRGQFEETSKLGITSGGCGADAASRTAATGASRSAAGRCSGREVSAPQPARSAGLGNTQNVALPQVKQLSLGLGFRETQFGLGEDPADADPTAVAAVARRERFAARTWLWRHSEHERVRVCGRIPVSKDGVGLRVGIGENGRCVAGYSRLSKCGSAWSCPVCAGKIARSRATRLTTAIERHIAAGGGIALLTLTVPHHKGQALQVVWDGLTTAWKTLRQGASWAGSARQRGAKQKFGILAVQWSTEVTEGENGFHPHRHCLVFTERPWSEDEGDEFFEWAYRRWAAGCAKANLGKPSKRHGVQLDLVSGRGVAKKVGEYLHKQTYKARSRSAAWEASGAPSKRGAEGHRTSFQLLGDAVAGDEVARKLWSEFEQVSRGRTQTYMPPLISKLVPEEEEKSDEQIVEEEVGDIDIGIFPTAEWARLRAHPQWLPRVLEIAEQAGEKNAFKQVHAFCEDLGVELVDAFVAVMRANGLNEDESRATQGVKMSTPERSSTSIDPPLKLRQGVVDIVK